MRRSVLPSAGRRRLARSLCLCALLTGAFAPRIEADFIPPYALSDFTLLNSANADGSATTSDGGHSIVLTGPNDGSGLPGYTSLTLVSKLGGVFRFHYTYNSLDSPGYDSASYIVNGQVTTFASADGQSGDVSVTVKPGDRFGFRVDTVDNQGEPGVLTISDFTGPAFATAVPAASTASLPLLAVLLLASAWLWMRKQSNRATDLDPASRA